MVKWVRVKLEASLVGMCSCGWSVAGAWLPNPRHKSGKIPVRYKNEKVQRVLRQFMILDITLNA